MLPTEPITKLDAATRQLDTAISLWFSEGDVVSIHTLACSAYQIIDDINQTKGCRDLLYDTLVVKDEYRQKLKQFLKDHYNFFKHAERDQNRTILFSPSLSGLFILFSILGLELFGLKHNRLRKAFITWYGIQNSERLTEKGKELCKENIPDEMMQILKNFSRSEFFDFVMTNKIT